MGYVTALTVAKWMKSFGVSFLLIIYYESMLTAAERSHAGAKAARVSSSLAMLPAGSMEKQETRRDDPFSNSHLGKPLMDHDEETPHPM